MQVIVGVAGHQAGGHAEPRLQQGLGHRRAVVMGGPNQVAGGIPLAAEIQGGVPHVGYRVGPDFGPGS